MRHRAALITAGSIAAVVFAVAIAVGVNLGILSSADSSPVGRLTTATVSQVSPAAPAAHPASKPASGEKQRATQQYVIEKAGNVRIAFSKKAVRFVSARARMHWTWKLAQSSDQKLTVTFTRGADSYTFIASVDAHGKLSARVAHPVTKVLPTASGGSSGTWAPAPAQASARSQGGEGGEGGSSGQGGADD